MRLSEAIRIGASWSEQGFGNLKFNGRTCALGAAYEGVFGNIPEEFTQDEVLNTLYEKFPILKFHIKEMSQKLNWLIVYWNDFTEVSRDEIANRVAEIENQYGWTGTPEIAEHEIADDTAAV